MKTLVSTLICTYNAKRFFDATIRSVLDQTYTNQEILIRDDCSIDGTIELLTERAKRDDRIKLFIDPGVKRGPYGGLNYLLDQSKGDYIAIQDHDDIWHPNKLKKQVKFLEENSVYHGVGTGYINWYEGYDKFLEHTGSHHETKIIPWHCSLCFRTTNKRYNTLIQMYTDYEFMLNLGSIHIIEEYLMIHRVRKSHQNLSGQRSKNLKKVYQQLNRTGKKRWKNPISYIYHLYRLCLGKWYIRFSIHLFSRNSYIDKQGLYKKYPLYITYLD